MKEKKYYMERICNQLYSSVSAQKTHRERVQSIPIETEKTGKVIQRNKLETRGRKPCDEQKECGAMKI